MALCVPNPPVLAYYSHALLSKDTVAVNIVMQVVVGEWAVQVLMAFVAAPMYGVHEFARVVDPRVYPNANKPVDPLFHLPPKVVADIRQIGLAAICEGCVASAESVDKLLTAMEGVAWGQVPEGFCCYDPKTEKLELAPEEDGSNVGRYEDWERRFGQICREAREQAKVSSAVEAVGAQMAPPEPPGSPKRGLVAGPQPAPTSTLSATPVAAIASPFQPRQESRPRSEIVHRPGYWPVEVVEEE